MRKKRAQARQAKAGFAQPPVRPGKKHPRLRRLAAFVACAVLVVSAQVGALLYLNNVYLKKGDSYTVTRITSSRSATAKHRTLTLPESATNVSVSHDGNYIAWLQDGQIQIADMVNGGITSVAPQKNRTIDSFSWIYDRDRLMVLQRNTTEDEDGDYYDEIYSYEVSDKTTQKLENYNTNKDVHIDLYSEKETVTAIQTAETTVLYFKLTTPVSSSTSSSSRSSSSDDSDENSSSSSSSSSASSGGRSRIWRINNPTSNAAISDLPSRAIGRISAVLYSNAQYSDALLFEDTSAGRVYLYNGGTERYTTCSVDGGKDLCILGFDADDTHFLGIVKDDTVTAFAYGDPLKSSWHTVQLADPAAQENIYVTYSGAVLVDDPEEQSVLDVKTAKTTSYAGAVLGVYDSGFYSVSDGTIHDHPLNNIGVYEEESGTQSDASGGSSAAVSASSSQSGSSSASSRRTSAVSSD